MKIIFKKPSCPPKANSSKKDLVYQNHPRLLEPWFFKKYLLFAYIFQVNFSLIHPHHCWVPTFNRWWSCEGPESMAKDPGVFSRFFFCHGFLTRAPRWSCWNRDQDSPYGWSALKGFEWSMICSKKNGDRNRNAMAMISRHFRNKKGRSLRCCNLFFPNTFWKKFEKFVFKKSCSSKIIKMYFKQNQSNISNAGWAHHATPNRCHSKLEVGFCFHAFSCSGHMAHAH